VTVAGWTGPVADMIRRVAAEYGVPAELALAVAQQESGFNPRAVGDNGNSFGLFQLNRNGLLKSSGLSQQQALDAETNARAGIRNLAAVARSMPGADYGAIAAAAQRPADRAGYAQRINALASGGGGAARAGGGAAPAGGGGAPSGEGPPNPADPAAVRDFIAKNYGYLAAWLDDPAIGPLLLQAGQQGWSKERLTGELSKTQWWQTHSQTQRQALALQRQDPATWQKTLETKTQQVAATASSLGVQIPWGRAVTIANDALLNGWSDLQTQNALSAEFKYTPGAGYQGLAGTSVEQLKQMRKQYMVPLSEQTIGDWTRQVLSGAATPKDFETYLKAQAKTLYPQMAAAIESGITPNQYADPYRQTAANLLGLNPDSIDFDDPKWQRALNTTSPDGQRSTMSLSDWQATVKSDPVYGYDSSVKGRAEATQLAQGLGQMFGVLPRQSGAF